MLLSEQSKCPMAALAWLWPLQETLLAAPVASRSYQAGEMGHSLMAQAICKQIWGRSWQMGPNFSSKRGENRAARTPL